MDFQAAIFPNFTTALTSYLFFHIFFIFSLYSFFWVDGSTVTRASRDGAWEYRVDDECESVPGSVRGRITISSRHGQHPIASVAHRSAPVARRILLTTVPASHAVRGTLHRF